MMNETPNDGLPRDDRELFRSLLQHVVRATSDEDPTDFVLATIGGNVGADRCYVYRFWEPGKTSMCTKTHEWCAEGIPSSTGGQQTRDLAKLVDFNALITSGRDVLLTDIDSIDPSTRDWLKRQGVQSLVAAPLVGAGNIVCGFAGFDFVKAPCADITDRLVAIIHEASDLLLNCQRLHEQDADLETAATYHDLSVALNLAHFKGEIVDFMFTHRDYDEVRDFIGEKAREITEAQHLVLCSDDGSRTDWFGDDAPDSCRKCVKAALNFGRHLPSELFSKDETVIIEEGSPLPDMNLPRYCPMKSSVISQFRRGSGFWRLVADYTKPHNHDLPEVARCLRMALELLAIAYDRERREETIATLQEHQQFRADTLAYALSKDDLPGLTDLILHRLMELTHCDYIAIHTVDGDHRQLHSGAADLETCPDRCESCPFYSLSIPLAENADHMIELKDAHGQNIAPLPHNCPAKSLEVAVVYRDGTPWGGIALHYLNRQYEISEDDRDTLKIAADVLTLAVERHSAAVRLKAERDRVLEAEKAKSYFFSAISHDIRTPLNAIIGFSELLQAGDVPPEEEKRDLKMIVDSGKTLLQLVNDILDFSKMDLGKLEFSSEPTDVGEIVREIVPMFRPTATTKGQIITIDVPALPRLMADPHRLRQVLFNFVSNAVKYAGPCTIRISATYENGWLRLTVADNGKGVSPEKAERLMQPFAQADIKNRTEGTGLGLAICKRLVEIAHGTISIETDIGKGFVIHANAPMEAAPESQRAETTIAPLASETSNLPKRILVVDDSPVNRMVLTSQLKKLGITNIELAENGKVALEKLEKDSAFDLVMSDMWMPVMDGNELVKNIRANKQLANLKVCSITADVAVRANYRDLGFDLILLKPVTLGKIADLLKGC